jgi:TolB-like protein/Tfp pilus assembly protein PilF
LAFVFEDFVLDGERRELRRGGGLVAVEPKVFDLLVHLVANRERVVSKDDLIAAVWKGRIVSESALTSAINAARTLLGDSGETQRLIKTLPRKGFRFVGEVQEGSGMDAPAAAQPKEAGGPNRGLASNASLAVLPFNNLSGEIEQEYFADGITDDVITELSRSRELFVIARNSSFQYRGKAADIRRIGSELGVRYVLEGSVRRSGQRVRVNVQLVDASTGVHLWAERYDREIADVLAIQDEVARAIVPMLVAHVTMAELERSATRSPTTWEAYDHLVKGLALLRTFQSTFGKDDLDNARASFERALQLDPRYARAHAGLSSSWLQAWIHNLDQNYLSQDALARAEEAARLAVQSDALLPAAWAQRGFVAVWQRQHAFSLESFERAIALNPNFCEYRYAAALAYDGQLERAAATLKDFIRRDPLVFPMVLGWRGISIFMQERCEEALPLLLDFRARAPNHRASHSYLAAAYARLGMMDEARAEIAELTRMDPSHRIRHHVRLLAPYRMPAHNEFLWEGLRMAGLPD